MADEAVREVVLGDLHAPDHNPWAWELACKLVEVVAPAHIVLLGDLCSFDPVSRFRQPAEVLARGLQADVDVLHRCLADLRSAAPTARIAFTPGNHEQRLEAWLLDHPGLQGLRALALPAVLELGRFNIEYCEREVSILRTLVAKHGSHVRKASGASALAELQDEFFQVSVIHGHTHRLGAVYATTRTGLVAAFENGCLCRFDLPYLRTAPNWQLGCSVVTHWQRDTFHVAQVPFLGEGDRLKAVVMGKEVRLGK